ncbi:MULTISPECIES: APC family permease [unclassified Pseudomonas]|uniref:APC family permease n=1 Tax=unclassified Pseudomonas TaxID=196821 RepID=UPI0002A307A4|nr:MULTISPECIES: APC family permease [unclassified Pseudomonas]MBB1609239.1 APC family amino acid permease [Pseudomonas sp. UMC76]MBB1636947.1 APC family amino acid permease [Pseudomonas sp. UME83]NTX89802.1 APC family permease [Pseudomonas sp. UMA643]NTY17652.1 APC family permease [Pseudomonas sp. UMC3103]NTY23222.1 APC family permease [Pseudomonas sp. UMA603]
MSIQQQLDAHLKRGTVGFPTALASTIGLIMASPVILTATMGFGIGGSAFAAAMVIAVLMMLAQSTTFAEAASILPTSGSVYDYISCGMGRFFAITGTIAAYLIVHVFAGTAETILSGVMALVNFEHLNTLAESAGGSWLLGVGFVVVFGILNVFGVNAFGRAEVVLTFGMWSTLMVFGVLGLLAAPAVQLDGWFGASLVGTDLQTILSLVGMAMFMFVGCEFVTPLAPDLRNSAKVMPRAMALGLFGVASCMFIYGAAMKRQVENVLLDPAAGVHLLDTPMAIPRFAEQVMGQVGPLWLGVGFLFAGAATINTLMAGVPRIMYGMAVDGALPRCFAYLQPRFKTPVLCILVAVLIPCLHALWLRGNTDHIMNLVLAAVCAWSTAYLLVTLSVVLLRIRRPDLPRAYRSPLFPLPQVVSSVGILIGMWYITPPGMNPADIYVPFAVMLGLTAAYALVWTLLVQKVNPFRPVPVEEVLEKEFRAEPGIHSSEFYGHASKAV